MQDDIYKKAIDTWGKKSQLLQTAEECTELAKAIIKYVNGRGTMNQIEEETADVEIMIEQMKIMINEALINGHKAYKLHRLGKLLEGDADD